MRYYLDIHGYLWRTVHESSDGKYEHAHYFWYKRRVEIDGKMVYTSEYCWYKTVAEPFKIEKIDLLIPIWSSYAETIMKWGYPQSLGVPVYEIL